MPVNGAVMWAVMRTLTNKPKSRAPLRRLGTQRAPRTLQHFATEQSSGSRSRVCCLALKFPFRTSCISSGATYLSVLLRRSPAPLVMEAVDLQRPHKNSSCPAGQRHPVVGADPCSLHHTCHCVLPQTCSPPPFSGSGQ